MPVSWQTLEQKVHPNEYNYTTCPFIYYTWQPGHTHFQDKYLLALLFIK